MCEDLISTLRTHRKGTGHAGVALVPQLRKGRKVPGADQPANLLAEFQATKRPCLKIVINNKINNDCCVTITVNEAQG